MSLRSLRKWARCQFSFGRPRLMAAFGAPFPYWGRMSKAARGPQIIEECKRRKIVLDPGASVLAPGAAQRELLKVGI
jgi:hypothetical protein